MNILSADNISKHYNEKILFENLTLGIDENDKIGLIGINGTGKSTLLKVLAGVEPADSGTIAVGNDIVIGYLSQNPDFEDDATVLQQVFKGSSPVMQLLREYESTLEKLNHHTNDAALQKRLLSLSQQMDSLGAWQIESEAKAILTKLGISDFEAKVGTLSGGQRKRIAIASVLINPADLLILDEPTNQIDTETVDWLEQYLNKRKGALIMVTHDRYFLDRVVNRIVELDRRKLNTYTGNYSLFLEKKVEREELEQANELRRQNLLRNELAWVQRGAKARSTKQKARLQRFERLQDDKPDMRPDKIDISVAGTRLGKKVIILDHVTKAYDDRTLIGDFSNIFLRDERTGIVGQNGSGKSTLLNIIAGRLKPDAGTVEIGQTVKVGYFAQETTEMDGNTRVIDYIKEGAELLTTGEGVTISASQMLEKFLFPPQAQWDFIANLSGGEKRRLYLLRVLMEAPNVLLLDEPTNDLDIQTLTILEDYLDQFEGAVIVVSHDRYLLDRIVDKILAFEDHGQVNTYVGDYTDYMEKVNARRQQETQDLKAKTTQNTKSVSPASKNPSAPTANSLDGAYDKRRKFTFKEQKEYETIDQDIAQVETDLEAVNSRINQSSSDFTQLQKLVAEQQALEQRLEGLMERWVYLNEIAEEMARSK